MIKQYYVLTKPGIIYGNLLTVIAGYLYATTYSISIVNFIATCVGISFVIGSACAVNNCIDRTIDSKMSRTKKRPLVTKTIKLKDALLFAILLGIVGFGILLFFTNVIVVSLGIIGFIDYVLVYTYYKRHSALGTIVGSVSGAVPITAGYCAKTNSFDMTAVYLFIILVIWQMPHFYAIAIGRIKDYKSASIPVLPLVKGITYTKYQMLVYIVLFGIASVGFTYVGPANNMYLVIMCVTSLIWIWFAIQNINASDHLVWAKKLFRLSLVVILLFSIALAFGSKMS